MIEFGDFRFEPATPLLTRNSRSVEIAPKALKILAVLVENAGQVVGKDDLLSNVWRDEVVEEGNLAVYISALRKVLGETVGGTGYIETVPKRGYRFVASISRPPSVAVLPFDNLSPEPDTEYFSDSLTEELIRGLTKLGGLMVVAWSSAARLKGQPFDVREIGRKLNVSSLLLGSIRTSGKRLRVMTQLVDTADGRYLWSEAYERQVNDLFAIQEEISRAIVKTLQIKLMDRPGTLAIRQHAYNLEAYNLYLMGRFQWNKRTVEGLKRGMQHFEQAVTVDRSFAPGYVGLADSYSLLAEYGLESPAEVMPTAKAHAKKALEIDPTLAEAHTSLALIRSHYDWRWADAEQHYIRAIELNPGYATARHWFAVDYLGNIGRPAEGLEQIDVALTLDPLSPIIREAKGFLLTLCGRYDEAIEEYRRTLDLDSFFYKAFTSMGRAYTQKGLYEEAIPMLQKGRSLSGDIPSILGALGQTYAMAGQSADARRLLEELGELAAHRYVPSRCFALIHLGLGEKARALEWLEAGVLARDMGLCALKAHPAYNDLRGEPRFQAILRQIKLAPAALMSHGVWTRNV